MNYLLDHAETSQVSSIQLTSCTFSPLRDKLYFILSHHSCLQRAFMSAAQALISCRIFAVLSFYLRCSDHSDIGSNPSSDEKQTLWIDSIAFCLRCVTIYSHQVFFFSFATSNSRKFQSEKVQMTKSVQKDRKWIYNKFRLYSRKSKNTQTVQRPPECLRGRGSRYGTAGPGPEGALSITSRTRSISRFVRAGSKEFNWNEAAFPSFSSWKPVIDLYNMSHWATPPEWTSNVKRKVTISHWIL